jgi:hypothetical protein
MNRAPTEAEMIAGIAKGFSDFLHAQRGLLDTKCIATYMQNGIAIGLKTYLDSNRGIGREYPETLIQRGVRDAMTEHLSKTDPT